MDGQNGSESADEGFVDDSNIEEGMDMVHMVNADDIDEVIDSGDEVAFVPEGTWNFNICAFKTYTVFNLSP